MTYDGAVEFCNWMGGRLPTESEWEYAALFDGEKLRDVLYAWGDEEPDLCVNSSYERNDLDGNYSYCRCSNENIVTLPNQYNMGYQAMCKYENLIKDRTPTGLAHMSGHLAEYVSDYIEDAPNNFDRNECHLYILKGGSYLSPPEKLKIREREYFSYCGHANPATGEEENDYIPQATGFRCVFDVDDRN